MGFGDEILAAGQAQRLYDASGSRVEICGSDGKRRWHPIWDGNPIIAKPHDVFATDARVINGPGCRPYIVYPFNEDLGWTFNTSFKCREHVARIYLTPAEQRVGTVALDIHGPYVLIEPFTKHQNFRWPISKWVQLVAACPDLTFLQHTHKESVLVAGAIGIPATFREACGLVMAADCYVRSESGMCHAAAALGARQVTLFGGCMDADVMGGYVNQTVMADRGEGSPCGSWKPCKHCADAMKRITVTQVVAALRERLAERQAA